MQSPPLGHAGRARCARSSHPFVAASTATHGWHRDIGGHASSVSSEYPREHERRCRSALRQRRASRKSRACRKRWTRTNTPGPSCRRVAGLSGAGGPSMCFRRLRVWEREPCVHESTLLRVGGLDDDRADDGTSAPPVATCRSRPSRELRPALVFPRVPGRGRPREPCWSESGHEPRQHRDRGRSAHAGVIRRGCRPSGASECTCSRVNIRQVTG